MNLNIILNFIKFIFKVLISKDVKIFPKLLMIAGIFYLVLFIDFIPDFIPFIGLIDDAFISSLLVYLGISGIPKSIAENLWKFTSSKIS